MSKFDEYIQIFIEPQDGVMELNFTQLRTIIKDEITRCFHHFHKTWNIQKQVMSLENFNGATHIKELIFHYEEFQKKNPLAKKIYFGKTYTKTE